MKIITNKCNNILKKNKVEIFKSFLIKPRIQSSKIVTKTNSSLLLATFTVLLFTDFVSNV